MKISYILKENCNHYNEYYLYYNNGYYNRFSITEEFFKHEEEIINQAINVDILDSNKLGWK